jgi:hypothetical protein
MRTMRLWNRVHPAEWRGRRHPGGKCPICGAELERVQVGSRHAYYPNHQQNKGD